MSLVMRTRTKRAQKTAAKLKLKCTIVYCRDQSAIGQNLLILARQKMRMRWRQLELSPREC